MSQAETKSPETMAAEAATKEAEKAASKAAKEAERKASKAAKEAERKAAKEKKEAEKAASKAAAAAKKAADKAAKEESAKAAAAAKEALKQPEQNGVRRPSPDGQCGKLWALADSMSAEKKAPVAIADLLVQARATGINDNTIRTQYAHWKKFHGVKGRVEKTPEAPATGGESQASAS